MLEYDIKCYTNIDKDKLKEGINKSAKYLLKIFENFEGIKPATIEIYCDNSFTKDKDVTGNYNRETRVIKTSFNGFYDVLLDTLAHEMNHQILTDRLTNPPRWLLEGLAQYHSVSDFEIRYGELDRFRLATIDKARKNNNLLKLEKLLENNYFDLDLCSGLAYAESWSFVHFLIEKDKFAKYIGRFALTKRFLKQEEIPSVESSWICYLDDVLKNSKKQDFWRAA